jgi:hypothetical protein
MWGNPEARIFDHHAAFISLALNMQLLLFNTISAPHVAGQGKRRAAIRFSQLPYPSFGVDPWVTVSITPLAKPPSRPMLSDHLKNVNSLFDLLALQKKIIKTGKAY